MPSKPQRDVDDVAVRRRLEGDRSVVLNIGEREEAVRRLHALDFSDALIAARMGASDRTVQRIRARLGLPAVPRDDMQDVVGR